MPSIYRDLRAPQFVAKLNLAAPKTRHPESQGMNIFPIRDEADFQHIRALANTLADDVGGNEGTATCRRFA
jgi:hypothetical protein